MTATNWTINTNQSDVLLKTKRHENKYLVSNYSAFDGSIAIKDDMLEDASVAFLLAVNPNIQDSKNYKDISVWDKVLKSEQPLTISFKSTSFQKINSNINFIKGYLTINNITKVVELDAVLTELKTNNGESKAVFEIFGDINRKEFELTNSNQKNLDFLNIGGKINLTANLEFTNTTIIN
ncbi:MAG TPA: YceI family protein [Flavobacterium sp.]|nr:YceI family protein [Flavobacterium sp.]